MASDVVRFICPNLRCKAMLCVPATARGKAVRCRNCGTRVRIPATMKADNAGAADAGAAASADHAGKQSKSGK